MLKVLIVDEKLDADALKALVEGWGYEAYVSYTGKDAIVTCQDKQPQALLLEVALPFIDGYSIAKTCRKISGDLTIVGVTKLDDSEHRHKAWDAGFHFYMTKPIQVEKLHAILIGLAKAMDQEQQYLKRQRDDLSIRLAKRLRAKKFS